MRLLYNTDQKCKYLWYNVALYLTILYGSIFYSMLSIDTIDLFTSDCGLGACTKNDFFTQEKRLSILNLSQCILSLLVLKIGGNAIYKIFIPMSESITVNIIYMLSKLFKKINFIKQSAGSPGSSEIYIACSSISKMRHLSEEMEKKYLLNCLKNNNSDNAIFSIDQMDEMFILQIQSVSNKFVESQVKTLNRSFFYFYHSCSNFLHSVVFLL
jgi:hypothetical protein